MKYNIPKYYRYVILFKKEEMEDVEPIIKVPNLSELRSINKGRLHLFDEELLSILPAIEYCLHQIQFLRQLGKLYTLHAFISFFSNEVLPA